MMCAFLRSSFLCTLYAPLDYLDQPFGKRHRVVPPTFHTICVYAISFRRPSNFSKKVLISWEYLFPHFRVTVSCICLLLSFQKIHTFMGSPLKSHTLPLKSIMLFTLRWYSTSIHWPPPPPPLLSHLSPHVHVIQERWVKSMRQTCPTFLTLSSKYEGSATTALVFAVSPWDLTPATFPLSSYTISSIGLSSM